jgi:hypothetical protein
MLGLYILTAEYAHILPPQKKLTQNQKKKAKKKEKKHKAAENGDKGKPCPRLYSLRVLYCVIPDDFFF